jgi:hypothetical protein
LLFCTVTNFLPISLSPNLYFPLSFPTFSPISLSPNLYVPSSPFLPFLFRDPIGRPLPSFRFLFPFVAVTDGDGDDNDDDADGADGGGGDVPELRW